MPVVNSDRKRSTRRCAARLAIGSARGTARAKREEKLSAWHQPLHIMGRNRRGQDAGGLHPV